MVVSTGPALAAQSFREGSNGLVECALVLVLLLLIEFLGRWDFH